MSLDQDGAIEELVEAVACEDEVYSDKSDEEGICLEKERELDEALLEEERSSDDEEFDPENPNDTKTSAQKEREKEQSCDEEASDSEEEDDSCVCGDHEIEVACEDHNICVKASKKLFESLLKDFKVKGSKKEARAALAEVVCDHFVKQ